MGREGRRNIRDNRRLMSTVWGPRAQETAPPCRPVGWVVGPLGRPPHTALLWCGGVGDIGRWAWSGEPDGEVPELAGLCCCPPCSAHLGMGQCVPPSPTVWGAQQPSTWSLSLSRGASRPQGPPTAHGTTGSKMSLDSLPVGSPASSLGLVVQHGQLHLRRGRQSS